jgi:hypothetical protein
VQVPTLVPPPSEPFACTALAIAPPASTPTPQLGEVGRAGADPGAASLRALCMHGLGHRAPSTTPSERGWPAAPRLNADAAAG